MDKQSGIIIAIIALGLYFARNILNNKLSKDLMSLIGQNDQLFMKKINSFAVKMSFQPFNRDYMVLNHVIMMDDEKRVDEQFAYLDAHKLNKNQTLAIYQKTFMYYLKKGKSTKAKDIYKRVCDYVDEKKLNDKIKAAYEKDIMVYLDKDIKVLTTLDQLIEEGNDDAKALLYLEKTYVLKYNRRMDEALKCMKNVIKYTKNPSQKQVMQDLLDSNLEAL